MSPRLRAPLATGAVALVAVMLGVAVGLMPGRSSPSAESLEALTQQPFRDAAGAPVQLDRWRGQLLVVNFWATWCAPCKEEIPGFIEVQRDLPSGRASIIGIAIDSAANVSEFATTAQFNYPILIGGANTIELLRRLGNPTGGLPYTLILGADGKVIATHLGVITPEGLRKQILWRLG